MILQSNKLGTSYIHNNSPTPLWKIARVPSARATNTIPFTCLQQEKGFQDSLFGNAGGTTCYWTSSQALRGPIHDIPDIPEPKEFFFFKSSLCLVWGSKSRPQDEESHTLYWPSTAPQNTLFLRKSCYENVSWTKQKACADFLISLSGPKLLLSQKGQRPERGALNGTNSQLCGLRSFW